MLVTVQVGQCGNQLGKQFFDTIAESATSTSDLFSEETKERFFSEGSSDNKLYARAVLVDCEPKAIKETLRLIKQQSTFRYREDGTFFKKEGAANNWAMGYFEHGSTAKEQVLNLIRKESERCDYVSGFLIFMSVAGGTGSGLGTSITEMLRSEFSSVPIVNQVIWPFQKGEVTVQAYNSLLTLSHLQSCSDAMILSENDHLYKVCSQRLGMKNISLNNLNVVASQQLASLVLPSKSFSGFSSLFGDILAHVVPHPQFKVVNLRSVPQEPSAYHSYSTHSWKSLLRSLRRMLLYNSMVEESVPFSDLPEKVIRETPVSLANLLLLRGTDPGSADSEFLHQPSLPYATWVPSSARLKTWVHPAQLFGQQRIATVANNGQVTAPCMDKAASKSWKMFCNRAYIHHYQTYGLQSEDFLNSFSIVEQLVASYKALKAG